MYTNTRSRVMISLETEILLGGVQDVRRKTEHFLVPCSWCMTRVRMRMAKS